MPGKKRKGFTLVELLVVAGIFAMLASELLIDMRGIGKNQRLLSVANEISSRIKQAQGLAYSNTKQSICTLGAADGFVCGSGTTCGGVPANCTNQYIARYGIRFDTDGTKKKYMIGADYNAYGSFDVREAVPGGIITLPSGITITQVCLGASCVQGAGLYDLNYIYDAADASPFISCGSTCANTTITITDSSVSPSISRTVTVQKMTGLVSVQ
jgi:prepilin-type N-terminal cleavage/methylation domain-containing protein